MIDIHCHILPGLDDGAVDMEEAVAMCRIAAADGIRTVVATPHCQNGLYDNSEKTIIPVWEELQAQVKAAGIDLELVPGADIHFHPEMISFLKQNPRLLLGGRYFLLELPAKSVPAHVRDFIFDSLLAGLVPVVTHPERNTVIQNQPRLLEEWIEAGALGQVTAMSLTGDFGSQVRDCALTLVRAGLVQVIASDAHSPRRRPPVLSRSREVLVDLLTSDQIEALVRETPQKLLQGQPVERVRPEQPARRSVFGRFFRGK
jgi:protein-tyrosine phosphatase